MDPRGRSMALALALLVVGGVAPARAGEARAACARPRPVVEQRGHETRTAAAATACGMFTGFGGSEARIAVTNDGTVVYEPAVLTPGLLGTGYVPGAPGPQPQTQTSPGGLAVSTDDGGRWRFVAPGGATWTPQDDQLATDPYTGRIFWYAMQPNPFPQPSSGIPAQDQAPLGYANLLTSPDDGRHWSAAALPGYLASENPRFAFGLRPAGGARPHDSRDVAYWCGNNALFVYVARECWRSLDGGDSWQFASVLFHRGPSELPECGGNEEQFNDGDGNYPQAAPDGSLFVMVQCGGRTFLARSSDEAATWPIVHVGGKPLRIPNADELRIDAEGNMYAARKAGDHLFLRVSRDLGRTWSGPIDVLAPEARALDQWYVSIGDPGEVAFAYLAKDGSRAGYDGYLTMTRDALSNSPPFFSTIANDPRHPLEAAPGTPAKDDFVGVDVAPDGTAWGAFYADCTPRAPECAQGGAPDIEADRAFAAHLIWNDPPPALG